MPSSSFKQKDITNTSYSAELSSSVIVFMDLRNDIVVLNTRLQKTSQVYSSEFTHEIQDGIEVVPPNTKETTTDISNDISFKLKSSAGTCTSEKGGYQAMIGTDNSNGWFPTEGIDLWWSSDFTHTGEDIVSTYTVPVFTTQHPVGSWSVDANGNSFCSFIYPVSIGGGKFTAETSNSINGNITPETLCKINSDKLLSFYPIGVL